MTIKLGPGAMVTAAFIGPGTLTTATAAGASSGMTLAWSLIFALIATLVLQELAIRSSLVTQPISSFIFNWFFCFFLN